MSPPLGEGPDAPNRVRYSVDYPDRLNRQTTCFRVIVVIPLAIVLALIEGEGYGYAALPRAPSCCPRG